LKSAAAMAPAISFQTLDGIQARVILQPYMNLIELTTTMLEKIRAQGATQRRLAELQTLWNISQSISVETDLKPLYKIIHEQVGKAMGEVSSFAIALYESDEGMVHIPYMISDGKPMTVTTFPIGEGVTSYIIRTSRPLLIVENAAEKLGGLGGKVIGEQAKSWLGVPLIYAGETFGAIIIQDIHQEFRFTEEDQRLLGTIATQVAAVIRNARLLERSRKLAEKERLVNEITGKIRRSADLRTIIKTTADELVGALNARRAYIRIEPQAEAPLIQNTASPNSDAEDTK
jgi:GAF domain-containing protein